jgi:hypothetical protein
MVRRPRPPESLTAGHRVEEPTSEPMSDSQRRELIAESAYFLSEWCGFRPGHEAEDWHATQALMGARYRALDS